jgi:hypothetical protein
VVGILDDTLWYLEVSDRKRSVTETLYYVKEHPESRWSSLSSPHHSHPSLRLRRRNKQVKKKVFKMGVGKFTTEPKVIEMCL